MGENIVKLPNFDDQVCMWVFEEIVNGRKLSELINEKHENEKYLPGILLPENVRAVPDVCEAAKGATHLIFVIPHQFLEKTCRTLTAAPIVGMGCKAISLIKGISFDPKEGPKLLSTLISDMFGGIPCAILMGANVANEVAKGEFCEATIGVNEATEGVDWHNLFHHRCVLSSLSPLALFFSSQAQLQM